MREKKKKNLTIDGALPDEKFVPAYCNPKYYVSNLGRVYSTKTGKFMKVFKNNYGYDIIRFHEHRKRTEHHISKLMFGSFNFVPNERQRIVFKDNNRNNCVLDNIACVDDLIVRKKKSINASRCTPVLEEIKPGKYKVYASTREFARMNNECRQTVLDYVTGKHPNSFIGKKYKIKSLDKFNPAMQIKVLKMIENKKVFNI